MIVTTTEAMIYTAGFGLGFISGSVLGVLIASLKKEKVKPISYPEKPVMDKMYLSVIAQIKAAKNPSDLYAAYSSIIKFRNEFIGEGWLVGIVEQLYNQREEEINNKVV